MASLAFQFWSGLLISCAGAFYAGYQRGRRVQQVQDTAARAACVAIAERLADEQLSGMGRDVRNIALKGLL